MRKKTHKRTMPINMRKREGEKRVFIFVIEHNTNTITILLPLLYSSLSARKFCLLTEKYARKKNVDLFFFHRAEYKRKKRKLYLFDISSTFKRAFFFYYHCQVNSR